MAPSKSAPSPAPKARAAGPAAYLANLRSAAASAGAKTWIAYSVLIATAIAGAVVAVTLRDGSSEDPSGLGDGSGFATACDGSAQQELAIGSDTTTVDGLLCFTVSDFSRITLSATPVDTDADLRLWVSMETGEVVAENDDTYGRDPEVVFEARPGTYFVSVAQFDGGNAGRVTLHSFAVPLAEPPSSALPTADECARLSGTTIEGSGTGTRTEGEPFTCLRLDAPSFTKIGAIADDPTTMDLTLAVYAFDESGVPQFVRSVDDTFRTDPELNVDLAPGLYLIEVTSRSGGDVGAHSVYVDTTGTYFRTGAVSSGLATLRPGACASLPAVTVGAPLSFDATASPLACLTLDAPQRLIIMAATQVSQDLTIEIAGFDASGAPVRYVWADEDVFGENFDSQDPRVDLVLPAGTYVFAVAEYWGEETAHDFVLTTMAAD